MALSCAIGNWLTVLPKQWQSGPIPQRDDGLADSLMQEMMEQSQTVRDSVELALDFVPTNMPMALPLGVIGGAFSIGSMASCAAKQDGLGFAQAAAFAATSLVGAAQAVLDPSAGLNNLAVMAGGLNIAVAVTDLRHGKVLDAALKAACGVGLTLTVVPGCAPVGIGLLVAAAAVDITRGIKEHLSEPAPAKRC